MYPNSLISITQISHSYSKHKVLNNISLNVDLGTTTSLIGPSGCGKSTLLRITMGLITPDSGSVMINNAELTELNKLELRQSMGYVIQKDGLFPHLTGYENCSLVGSYLNWNHSKIEERIKELADLVSIPYSLLTRYPSQISGGQQQRIGLVRALMLDPDVLLLDEPLGSIDPLVRYELQNDLKRIFEQLNKTVILVTHELNEAAFFGDNIVLMNEGEIVQQGSISDLLNTPKEEFVTQFIRAQRGSFLEEAND